MAIKEYDEAKGKLSTYVPYICLVDEGIVLNQNGTLQTTIKYRGFDLDSCTAGELESINARLNDIIKRFGGEWSLFIEARRIKSNAYEEINSKYIVVNILEKIRYIGDDLSMLPREDCKVMIDEMYIMACAGVLSRENPEAAKRLLRTSVR